MEDGFVLINIKSDKLTVSIELPVNKDRCVSFGMPIQTFEGATGYPYSADRAGQFWADVMRSEEGRAHLNTWIQKRLPSSKIIHAPSNSSAKKLPRHKPSVSDIIKAQRQRDRDEAQAKKKAKKELRKQQPRVAADNQPVAPPRVSSPAPPSEAQIIMRVASLIEAEQLKITDVQEEIKREMEKGLRLDDDILHAKKDNKWVYDRIRYMQRILPRLEGEKRNLLKDVERFGIDTAELESDPALVALIFEEIATYQDADRPAYVEEGQGKHPAFQDLQQYEDIAPAIIQDLKNMRVQTCALKKVLEQRVLDNNYKDKTVADIDRSTRSYKKVIAQLEDFRTELNTFLPQIRYELEQLTEKGATFADADVGNTNQYPDQLADLESWSKDNLQGRVVVLRNVFKEAAKNDYRGYQYKNLMFQSLELLRDEFWTQKMSGQLFEAQEDRDYARRVFEERLRSLHLRIGASVTTVNKNIGSAYVGRHNGRDIDLGLHFAKGLGTENRNLFRLYFGWDNQENKVVVGGGPNHLPTVNV